MLIIETQECYWSGLRCSYFDEGFTVKKLNFIWGKLGCKKVNSLGSVPGIYWYYVCLILRCLPLECPLSSLFHLLIISLVRYAKVVSDTYAILEVKVLLVWMQWLSGKKNERESNLLCDLCTTLLLQAAVVGGGTDSDVNPFADFGVSGPSGPSLPPQGGVNSQDTTSTTTTGTADLLGGLDPLAGVGSSGMPSQAPTVPPAQSQGDNHTTTILSVTPTMSILLNPPWEYHCHNIHQDNYTTTTNDHNTKLIVTSVSPPYLCC